MCIRDRVASGLARILPRKVIRAVSGGLAKRDAAGERAASADDEAASADAGGD